MNNHEMEQHYDAKMAEIEKKYDVNIRSFSKYHHVDMDDAKDFLIYNAKCFAKGITKEVIPGGGSINVPELVKDYNELAKFIVRQ